VWDVVEEEGVTPGQRRNDGIVSMLKMRGIGRVNKEGRKRTHDQSKLREIVLAMPSSDPMKYDMRSSMAVDGSRSRVKRGGKRTCQPESRRDMGSARCLRGRTHRQS
jgi:hypothetical protein